MEFQIIQKMKHIWFQVPKVHCKGLCQDSCQNVPVMPVEAEYLQQQYSVTLPVLQHGGDLGLHFQFHTLGPDSTPCQFLNEAGRCSIYRDRPLICRSYGHDVDFLRCQWGCDEAKFNSNRLQSLMKQMVQLSSLIPKYRNYLSQLREDYMKSR